MPPSPPSIRSELRHALEHCSPHSATVVLELRRWANETSAKLSGISDASLRVAASDAEFQHLWEALIDTGFRNPCANGLFAFAQGIENTTHELEIDAAWRALHKGAHYYNMGLLYFSLVEVDRAFKFFLMADEEDASNKGTTPGDLFRQKRIFVDMRDRFVNLWLTGTHSRFHDGLTIEGRGDLIATAIAAIPDRYLLARCLLGLLRANTIHLRASSNVRVPVTESLMAVEDLALLTEAAARMFHEGVWLYSSSALFGAMLRAGAPAALLGFEAPNPRPDINNETAFRSELNKASTGVPQAMAGIVNVVRNQSAHASPYPQWFHDQAVLEQVQLIQIDFVTVLLSDLMKRVAPPASAVPPPRAASTLASALAAPSGSTP